MLRARKVASAALAAAAVVVPRMLPLPPIATLRAFTSVLKSATWSRLPTVPSSEWRRLAFAPVGLKSL